MRTKIKKLPHPTLSQGEGENKYKEKSLPFFKVLPFRKVPMTIKIRWALHFIHPSVLIGGSASAYIFQLFFDSVSEIIGRERR